MNSFIKNAGRAVIVATLLSASLSAVAQDSSGYMFMPSKAPRAMSVNPNATAPAAYPESFNERVKNVRHPNLAFGQGEGKAHSQEIGGKAAAALRLVRN